MANTRCNDAADMAPADPCLDILAIGVSNARTSIWTTLGDFK
jgi:hypothetical protein